METLQINESYFLTTVNFVRSNERVAVVSIMNYEEANKRFPLNNIALNHKVSPTNIVIETIQNPYELYFRDKIFYICAPLDRDGKPTTGEEFAVWGDIIDWNLTRIFQKTRNFKMTLYLNHKLNKNVAHPLTEQEVLIELKRYAEQLGSEIVFSRVDDQYVTSREIFDDRVVAINDIMTSMEKLVTVAPIIDRINNMDINSKIDQISADVEILGENITTIKAGLRV